MINAHAVQDDIRNSISSSINLVMDRNPLVV